MGLFKFCDFVRASGEPAWFKVECDALTDEDWAVAAAMLASVLPPFFIAYGVPTGGVKLARALIPHESDEADTAAVLVVEDVVTTGGSMERYIESAGFRGLTVHRAALFALRPVPGVTALFTLRDGAAQSNRPKTA